ncbi:MAG TPA: amino acid ABC transporter substrate-binding protein [Burkholderiales bacterium]|nr:amino acid ABC transporter substrate-binding protein [Burkholderiales bacterium]
MKRTVPLLAAAALALSAALPASALEGTLKKIKDTGSITIGHRDASLPLSYLDDNGKPIGYAMDLCHRIVGAVKANLKMPKIDVKYQLVTSANRIPLMANGTIDLECGSTTNNLEREKQVSFTITHFVTANKFVSKRSAKLHTLADLKGKTVVSTAGTTNIKQLTKLNAERNLDINIVSANGHPEAFQMVESGRAAAFVMDDILLYGLVANSKNPKQFVISKEALSVEPYGIMVRKDDSEFKKVVDAAMTKIYKSGEGAKLYAKWFQKPIPPRGINLNVPMSPQLKKVMAHPTDSGDPADYK